MTIHRLPRPQCRCEQHSEYLYGDNDGWHCQTCNGLVASDG